MEPALAILVCHHAVGLVHFIGLVWELLAEVEYADFGELVQLVLEHRVAPVVVVQVEDALLLDHEFVVVFYRPHFQRVYVYQVELVRLLSLHLLELDLGRFNYVAESIAILVEGHDELTVRFPLLLVLVVNPYQCEAAVLLTVTINYFVYFVYFFVFNFI